MKSILILWTVLALAAPAAQAGRARPEAPSGPRIPVVDGEGTMLTSNSSASLAARETAGPDTFVLYGGPGEPVEGKFQLSNMTTPDWGDGTGSTYTGDPAQWRPVDLTDLPVFWHISEFNAQTLGTSQPSPNRAMWCGVDADDPYGESWVNRPGYGNNWTARLVYESAPLADPTVGETVGLDFFFHHDTEPVYDFFTVEYDSAGMWIELLSLDGTDADSLGFHAPGVQYSTVKTGSINYAGNDFGGELGDQIVIRIVVTSDGVWSDEDGLWPTRAGAAQVDEITLVSSQGTFTEDYEGAGPYLFHPEATPFAGDFAEVYPLVTDLDPCRDNITPVIGMVDYGQIVRNGPGAGGEISTGGSTSPGVNYGIPGNYVVNYSGGLSFGEVDLTNEIWSPEILWDVAGSEDDDIAVSGSKFRVSAWMHMPLINGMFFVWHVRSALPGQAWNQWDDRNFVYYGGGVPQWANYVYDVTDLIQPGPERVQVALGVWDYASVFGFAGTAATPSPFFDDVAFYKYRIGGPTFATRTIDTAQDGFPINGSIDVSTPASRGALDIPFSMARDVNTGDMLNVPGDSIIVDVAAIIPGSSVTDIRMVWALQTNGLFEDALRAAPSRPEDENVVAGASGTIWTGEVVADSSKTAAGVVIADRYFFDLPDEDFLYPGDVLHYYIEATDSDGRTATLPADTGDFLDFGSHGFYDRAFTVRGLPSIRDTEGRQPELLVWNDFGRRGGENEWLSVFYGRGLIEGLDFDSYTTQGPTSLVSNGLGSSGAHGANADQLVGYEHILYFAGNLSTGLLSNGSNRGNNDKSNDIGLLEQWHALPGNRNVVYFGDYIASALNYDSAEGASYLSTTMGVGFGDSDVRDVIGGQLTPLVVPNEAGVYESWFATDFVAFGGCPAINQFDQIQPGLGASAGHLFTDPGGVPYPPHGDPASGGVASVIHPTTHGYDVTFPVGFSCIYTPASRGVAGSSRECLLLEVLALFQYPLPIPNDVPPVAEPVALSASPNPFNPVTTIRFTALAGSRGSVKVYNLRGELVRVLHNGEFQAEEFLWDGTDRRGKSVASGVYLVKAEAGGRGYLQKIALVR